MTHPIAWAYALGACLIAAGLFAWFISTPPKKPTAKPRRIELGILRPQVRPESMLAPWQILIDIPASIVEQMEPVQFDPPLLEHHVLRMIMMQEQADGWCFQ
jgi:hypothetical protein